MKDSASPIPPQWTWHYHALLKMQQTLRREQDARLADATAPYETPSDFVDIANEDCAHQILLAELAHQGAELAEVDDALARLRAGTYGICEATGKPIEPARLRTLPWTRFSQLAAKRNRSLSPALRLADI